MLAGILGVLGCGFDPAGLGGGVDAPLGESSVSASTASLGTTLSGGPEEGSTTTGQSLETTASVSADGTATSTSGVTGEGSASTTSTAGEASEGAATMAGEGMGSSAATNMSASADTANADASTSLGAEETASGDPSSDTSSTGPDPCQADAEGDLIFAEEAALDGYSLEGSDLLPDHEGDPVLYARAEGPVRGRSITYTFDVRCPTTLQFWGLIYRGGFVEPAFALEVSEAPDEASRWNFACLDEDEGWQWAPVAASVEECLDRPLTFEVSAGEHRVRLVPTTGEVSVMAALAYSSDPQFDPSLVYSP